MDPSDPGTKLPEGPHDNLGDTNGRKEHSPPVPPEPSGSSPTLGTITKREPSGKGGKGKSSTPKKRSSSQSSIIRKESGSLALRRERSSSVKDPTQSSILQRETVPIAPQVVRRSKSIRRTNRDSSEDYLTPSVPVGIGFDSPPSHSASVQPTSATGTPVSNLEYDTGPSASPISSLLATPEQTRANNRQSMRDRDFFFGYDTDQENIDPMDGSQGQPLLSLTDTQFRQEQMTQRNMTQNDASRHGTQGDSTENQSQSLPRIDPALYGHRPRRVSLPENESTSQEDRNIQSRQDPVRLTDQDEANQTLYAPQSINGRGYRQFQDPVQATQRRPGIPSQGTPQTRVSQENHSFLRPEIPRVRPENPRADVPRQEVPRLLRSETHPPRQRENVQQQAPNPQEQALRLQLDLTTQLASLQAKVLEANNNKTEKVAPSQNNNPVEGEISDDEYSEEEETDWAGRVIDKEDSKEVFLSADAFAYWNSLIGIDDSGIKTLKFKRPLKQTLVLGKFSEGEFVITAPVHNNELPRLATYDQKKEDDMFSDQRHIAAASTSVCMSVDGARKTIADLRDSATDFAEGRVDDPARDAYRILLATATLLEEEVISNSVQATKFLASTFGAISLSKLNTLYPVLDYILIFAGRHVLALSAVSDREAKRILEKSPPTKDLLFGDKVKESVQQIRDSMQIKKVLRTPFRAGSFQRRSPYTKSTSMYGYRQMTASGKPRTPHRPPSDRFKPMSRGRFGKGRGRGLKKDAEDKDG